MESQEQRKPFPIGLVALVTVAVLVGLGLAVLILGTNSAVRQNGLPAIPTSSRALLREGAPAPQFTLNTLDGQPMSLADVRGKPVMINFWASWCPPCLEETPALIQAYNELKAENTSAEFIGIGTNDNKESLQKFTENNDIPYIVVEDPDGKASDAYGVRGMPTTVFLDSNGIVRRIWNGAIKREQVLEIMRGLN